MAGWASAPTKYELVSSPWPLAIGLIDSDVQPVEAADLLWSKTSRAQAGLAGLKHAEGSWS